MPTTTDDGAILHTTIHAGLQGAVGYTRVQQDGRVLVAIVTAGIQNPSWVQIPTEDAAKAYIHTVLESLYQHIQAADKQSAAQTHQDAEQERQRRAEAEKRAQKTQARQQRNEKYRQQFAAHKEAKAEAKRDSKVLDKALSFACPVCPAQAWKRCKSPSGETLPRPHQDRLNMAERMIR